MATTTKSQAKTKTTKKSATKKPVKKTVAAKTTKKSTAIKAAKVQAIKKSPRSFLSRQLTILNGLTVALSVIAAAAAGLLMNHSSYQLFMSFMTRDELSAGKTSVFVPAIRNMFDLELRWAVVAILLLAAVVPLLNLTRYKVRYQDSVRSKFNLLRWVDMAVISSLMVVVIAIVSGVQDLSTLKLIGAFMALTCVLGYLSDRKNANAIQPNWTLYIISLVTGTLPWLVIASSAVGTVVYGMLTAPWYVYALYATTFAAFLGYAYNQVRQLRALQDYQKTERNYLQLNLFARLAFALILIAGLLK